MSEVVVDVERCGGHGVCVQLVPQLFDLSDDGYAVTLVGDVPAELLDGAGAAATQCPTHAISLTDRPGSSTRTETR